MGSLICHDKVIKTASFCETWAKITFIVDISKTIQRKDNRNFFLMSCVKNPNDYDHTKNYLTASLY